MKIRDPFFSNAARPGCLFADARGSLDQVSGKIGAESKKSAPRSSIAHVRILPLMGAILRYARESVKNHSTLSLVTGGLEAGLGRDARVV